MARFPLRAPTFSAHARFVSTENLFLWLQMGALIFLKRPFFWLFLTLFPLALFYSSFFLPPIFYFFILILLPNIWSIYLQFAFFVAQNKPIRFKKSFDFLLFLIINSFSILFLFLFYFTLILKPEELTQIFLLLFLQIFILFLFVFLFFLFFSFSPLLIFNQKMELFSAIYFSILAIFNNWKIFALLFLFCLLFLLLSILTAGLGVLIILPILSGTFCAAYEDLF